MLENDPAATLAQSEELQEKALLTFTAEQFHYSGIDLDSPEIIEAFGEGNEFIELIKAVKIPRKKWRKELWSRLLATAFSPKGKDAAQAKGKMNLGGYALGQISVSLGIFESLADDEDLRDDFDLSSEDAAEFKVARSNMRQNLASIDSAAGDEINEGFHAALRENRDGKQWTNATSATQRYELMLMLGDLLENMRSVDKMYQHLTAVMQADGQPDLGISRNPFKEFCNEIGLQGKRYKRLKSN